MPDTPTETRRVASVRRDLNDLVRGPDGKVSAVKVGSAAGQGIAAYLLVSRAELVLVDWEILLVLFCVLIVPDSIKKLVSMKYGGSRAP